MLQSKNYKLIASLVLATGQVAAASGAGVSQGPVLARTVALAYRHPTVPVLALGRSVTIAAPVLPALNWQQRSDWINVKTSVVPAAAGDGVQDDTAALQTALNQLQDGYGSKKKTIYLPAGTYKITKTLVLTKIAGAMIVGCGRNTRIVWAGPAGGTMYRSNGATYTRYIGLTWDGAGIAGVGVDHQSHTYAESRIRHQDEAFVNFSIAGIRVGYNQIAPTSEVMFRNCLFQNCDNGLTFLQWNDYDNDLDGCFFQGCGTAINCNRGNVSVSDCNFVGSTVTDMFLCTHSHAVRRSVSSGSNQFIVTPYCYGNCEVTVEDCRVDSWTGKNGAILFNTRGPNMIFDSVFTNSPNQMPPIRLCNPGDSRGSMTICNDAAPDSSSLIAYSTKTDTVVALPAGTLNANTPDLSRSFFKNVEDVSGKVLDVKTMFGAKGDSLSNDTAPILAAIAAAKNLGGGATVYFPPGSYKVYTTLPITGGGYRLEGAGVSTEIHWMGANSGPAISVQDPQNVTLAQMKIGMPANVTAIQQTSADNGTPSMMTYDGLYVNRTGSGVELVGLPSVATVHFLHLDGMVRGHDCSRATILLNTQYQGIIQVDGADYEKTGFFGCLMSFNALQSYDHVILDNQNYVGTNYYCEQTQSSLLASGNGAFSGQPGRITIQGTRNSTTNAPITINDYEGSVTFTGMEFNGNPQAISHTGMNSVEINLLADAFSIESPLSVLDSGAHLDLLQNILFSNDSQDYNRILTSQISGISDTATADLLSNPVLSTNTTGPLAGVAAALDDFRQLGVVDLALNHP